VKKIGVIIVACFMLIALIGFASADRVVPAVPETQGIVTTTIANVDGLVTETDAGVWTLTDNPSKSYQYSGAAGMFPADMLDPDALAQLIAAGGSYKVAPHEKEKLYITIETPSPIPEGYWITQITIPDSLLNVQIVGVHQLYGADGDDGMDEVHTWGEFKAMLDAVAPTMNILATTLDSGIHTGILNTGQVQYTTSYDKNIVAQTGLTSLVASQNLNTGNKVIGQSNLDAKTALTFAATDDGGNVVGSENLMLDGAATGKTASDVMLCPFSSAGANLIPAYCNIIQAGSAYDLTFGSVTTAANERFVGTDATMPVVLNYNINVKPYGTSDGQITAVGSASAYVKSHIQEARGATNNVKSEDLVYSETSSVNGMISGFSKDIKYQSGMSLL